MTAPRTWTLPPEPGPEVTAVRDKDGDVWRRSPESGWTMGDPARDRGLTWQELIRSYASLTDASEVTT